MLTPCKEYRQLCETFRWAVPTHYNIGVDICDKWAHQKDRLALIYEDAAGDVRQYTFRDLRNQSNRLANGLKAMGITRGDRVGIIGPNGSGKTTLLRVLLNQLKPQQGMVRLGTHLEVIYFDQLRDQLEEEKTVQENVAEGNDRVVIHGKTRHIIGYLQDFLFTPVLYYSYAFFS